MRAMACVFVMMAMVMAAVVSAGAQETAVGGEEDQAAKLAKMLANPIANLISVPLQYNYDEGYGPDGEGTRSYLNVQPVIPFGLSEDWNVITRTIVPLVDQQDMPVKGVGESGLGDIVASQFLSPVEKTDGWTWGVGPVELLPSASDDTLGGEQWGLGPTFVGLKQDGPWTFGLLANHLWSVAGDDDRADINTTFIQPFLSYITKTKTTLALNTESTYDWKGEAWSVPLNLVLAQMIKLGKLPLQVSAGTRYWAESPEYGADDWGARVQVTFLLPR